MRRFHFTCLVMSLTFPLVPVPQARADRLRNLNVGEPLPPFRGTGLDGQPVTSELAEGKALMLVYLSARQRQSEEAVASGHRIAGNIGGSKLAVVYMSADSEEADYFRLLRDRIMAHEPFVVDEGRTYYGQVGLLVFPTTLIASREGKLLHVLSGWNRDYEFQADLYCRHALGEFDDEELAQRLASKPRIKDEVRAKVDRHRSAAAILRGKGMAQAAMVELEQALAVDPECPDVIVDLADLLVSEGRGDEAEKRIQALLVRQPDFHRAKLVLGLISLKRDRLDQAEKLLNEALVMNPDPVRVHYYLGQLYEKKGEYKQAAEHYREALERSLNER
ncbi:MAG: tetratricopeptide repeat protein [Phycisphaerales bacterium]|nr:MAG: tetratricopeptide repeat protein [Phycisphaerales bacterium]